LQDPPNFSQIGIFGLKTNHLATLINLDAPICVPVLKKCFDGFCQDGSIHVDTIGTILTMMGLRVKPSALREIIEEVGILQLITYIISKHLIAFLQFFLNFENHSRLLQRRCRGCKFRDRSTDSRSQSYDRVIKRPRCKNYN
jgi:hypothetical protein